MFDGSELRRAKASIAKKECFTKRPKLWIKMPLLEQLVAACGATPQQSTHAKLYVLAYAFLLRVPSEALPATAGRSSGPCSLYREGEQLVLELSRRKNRSQHAKQLGRGHCLLHDET